MVNGFLMLLPLLTAPQAQWGDQLPMFVNAPPPPQLAPLPANAWNPVPEVASIINLWSQLAWTGASKPPSWTPRREAIATAPPTKGGEDAIPAPSPPRPLPKVTTGPKVLPSIPKGTVSKAAPQVQADPLAKPKPGASRLINNGEPAVERRPLQRLGARPTPAVNGVYPWRFNIMATVFWVGETATANNPVPNDKSSWDVNWAGNFGGYDDPNPSNRVDYRPRGFTPRQNPFYVALPYNDVQRGGYKPDTPRCIPWFDRDRTPDQKSVCKGKWVQIFYNGRYCFAQWEDCGPFNTEDVEYVFGDKLPVNTSNKCAGIDISPAVRDYLGIPSGSAKVHWRFVEFYRIPATGPWAKWGDNNTFLHPELDPRHKVRVAQLKRLQEQRDKALQQRQDNLKKLQQQQEQRR